MSDSNGGTVFVTREEMARHCPGCAERMAAANISRISLHDAGAWAAYAAKDPAAVCGSLWARGTEAQRSGFGKGAEGRSSGEKPPGAWWDECVAKVGGQSSTSYATLAAGARVVLRRPPYAEGVVLGPGAGDSIRVRFDDGREDEIPRASLEPAGWHRSAYAAVDLRSLGGRYRAEQASDGTWTIYDVPIFVAHVVKTSDGEIPINRAWMERAIAAADRRYAEDHYLPPLHVHHHGDGTPTEPAGLFRPRRVRASRYEGRTVDVLYADLVAVPDAAYQKIRAGQLAYRSAEVLKIGRPEVDSLALLPDRVPFFRLPLLTIGEEKPYRSIGPVAELAAQAAPALAYRALGTEGYAILLDIGGLVPAEEYAMPDEKKPADQAAAPPIPEVAPEKKPDEKAQADPVAAMKDAFSQIAEICRRICGEDEPAPAAAAPVPVQMAAGKPEARYSDREIDALARAKVAEEKAARALASSAKVEARLALDDALASAAKDLASKGFEASLYAADLREVGGTDGAEGIKRLLGAILKYGSPDPAPEIERAMSSDVTVQAYAAHGPAALVNAAKYGAEYDMLKGRGMDLGFSRDDHVKMCLEADGLLKTGR